MVSPTGHFKMAPDTGVHEDILFLKRYHGDKMPVANCNMFEQMDPYQFYKQYVSIHARITPEIAF
jgi:hypothetical protein